MSTLSTGQRQKMNMARGLLNDPWILFLDEPTLGLDVAAARGIRELVLAWKAAVPGRTVLLTTHYMAEADELCERIAIVDHGRILAIGTPDELKKRVQRESIFRLEVDHLDGGAPALARLPGVVSAALAAESDPEQQRVAINLVLEEDGVLGAVVSALGGLGSQILALRKSEPTLEDVFVELVGRGFSERGRGGAGGARRGRGMTADGPAPTAPAAVFAHSRGGTDPRVASRWTRRQVAANNAAVADRARVPARARDGPRALVAVLRDPAAVPHDVGVRVRLSGAPGARGVHRLRRAGRGAVGLLAQRRLDDGRAAVLGEEPGQPRALLRGAR